MTWDWSIVLAVLGIAFVKATPLIYAALGGVISENAGIVNIGLEGIMAAGAFSAVVGSYLTHDVLLATVAAMVTGACLGLLLAYFAIAQRADQIVVGMAINILGIGGAAFLLVAIFGQPGASPEVPSLSTLATKNPSVSLFEHDAFLIGALALTIIVNMVLYGTRAGVHLRAVGQAPHAALTAGIDVVRIRYMAAIIGGMLAAVGGASLAIGELDLYSDGMIAGRGFVALAAVIFGRWTPVGAAGACLIFGFFSSLQIALQRTGVPAQLLEMLPYALTIVALAGLIGRTRPPAAAGIPFER